MSAIILPQRFLAQPQYPAPLKDPGFWRLVDIQGLSPLGTAAASITRTLNGTAKLGTGRAGKCVDFVADGDWLSYGENPALQLSTMTGLAVVEVPSSPSDYSTIFNTKVDAAFSGGFVIRVNPAGTVTALKQDVVAFGTTVKTVKLDGVSTVAWSYNNVSGLLRIAIDGVLESFTSAQTINHGPVGRNQYYAGSATQAKAHKQYLFALSAECDKVADKQLRELSLNPWQIFKAPSRRLFLSAATPSGDGVGSASGSATVSGVGASIASASGSSSGASAVSGVGSSGSAVSSAGSASGVATVSGVGASVAGSTGSASGSAVASGVGASVAETAGASGGTSTASGVGDFTLPGSAVGTAYGTSSASGATASTATSSGTGNGVASVSGFGASTVSTQGAASGSATVSGAGDSIVPTVVSAVGAASGSSTVSGVSDEGDSLGGDDAILIYEEPKKKKRKPKKSIEDILGEAIKAIAKEAEPIPAAIDRLKESPKKEIVHAPVAKADPVEQFRAAEEEAQKVSALLAQYQEEVKSREFEDDEELLMLIAMEML